MKKVTLLVVVLLVCASIIYFQQNKVDESSSANVAPTDVITEQGLEETVEDTQDEVTSLPISSAAEGARAFFISPQNGDTVSSPVKVAFGLDNMQVSPAGIDQPFSGHHHILINMDELPGMSQPLPATDSLIHFGGGQTETELDLATGEHTLQLVLGNYLHIPHEQPVVSEKITFTVE